MKVPSSPQRRSPRDPHHAELALVAIGSNLGKPAENVRRAMARLEQFSTLSVLRSSLWNTLPVDCPSGSPVFVNAAVGIWPSASEHPESLLLKLQTLEREFGRLPERLTNEPRPLDLDLIAYGGQERTGPVLTLPHPRAHLRRFVLQPLAEIAPGVILPGQSRTIRELLAELGSGGPLVRQ